MPTSAVLAPTSFPPPSPLLPPATTDTGWLADMLHALGFSSATSRSVGDLAARPVALLLVIVVAALVGRYGSKAIRRGLGRVAARAAARSGSPRASARTGSMVALLANVWRVLVAVVAVLVGLSTVGLDLTPLVAGATVVGATIGFGAQSLVRDFLSGILLTMEDQYGIGDTIAADEVTGVVEDVSLRLTRVRSFDGTLWSICNGEIRRVANRSRGQARAVVDVTVPAGAPLGEVLAALEGAGDDLAGDPRSQASCLEPPAVCGIVATDASTATVRIAVQTTAEDRDRLERSYRQAALRRLQEAGLWSTGPTGT